MNNISEQLLQAMDVLVDNKISKLEYDKTIKAKITEIVNLDAGEYKVRYSGNIFSAFANDLKTAYKVDDSVYVVVPEGNFSGKKLITSLVSASSLSYNQLMALQNAVFEVSPEFDTLYGGNLYQKNEELGVIAGATVGAPASYDYLYEGPNVFQSDGFHGLFQQYANNYELIRIQASFMTQLQDTHIKGNYGVEIEFYAKAENGGTTSVSYRLDLTNFNGDPYRFYTYSPQSIIIKTQKNYLLGLKSVKLFEEGFEYDRIVKNGLVTTEQNTTVANIFAKDIKIQYVDVKDLTDSNYYLMIAAPQGIALKAPNITSLDLVGRLVYQGEDLMVNGSYDCQWFERDLSIMVGAKEYNKDAGFGWKPLDNKTNKITVNTNNVKDQNRYKLLTVYNKVSLSAEIEVFNQDSEYEYHIEQKTNGDEISLNLISGNEQNLIGDWYMSYPDGAYKFIETGNSIVVSPYLQYSSVIFYCAVRNSANEVIGTLEHTIINSESSEDLTIQYVGEDTFRYDANGDVTIENSEKDRVLGVNLTWKDGVGTAYTVNWIVRQEDGTEKVLVEGNDPISLPTSMMDKLWVDIYNNLHYTIKQKYKINFQNNTIIVKIKTIAEETYLFEKEILFLKDGDQGTNGTTYVVAVRPCDSDGKRLSGFNPIEYRGTGGWGEDLQLKCYVYKDGEFINNNPNYQIIYKWQGINIRLSSDIDDQIEVNGTGEIDQNISSTCQFYVKVQVSIADRINDRKNEIYASYPIDVIFGNIDTSKVDISSIPSYIKYTSSGVSPQFYSNNIECIYQDKNYNITSLNSNILDLEEKDNMWYLRPPTSFIFENVKENNESNVGVLKCNLDNGEYIIHPIIMYLDTYGNEAINGWDGTVLDIDKDNGQYIFAPQIGAGEKDSQNRFTGVVMGKDSGQNKIGLYGYQSGTNTFGLIQNGKAYFGAKSGGGQIVLDGRYATIFGGNVSLNESSGIITPAENGMYIRLADRNPDYTTKAIGIGLSTHSDEFGINRTEENFYVTYDGKLRATEANIQGNIYAIEGQIGGKNRQGGWTIKTNRLYSGSGTSHVELNSDPNTSFAIWAGKDTAGDSYSKDDQGIGSIINPADFVVTRDGFLYAKNARIKGNIEADTLIANKKGQIGGWNIDSNSMTSSQGNNNRQVGMASSGNAAFWVGNGLDSNSNNIRSNDFETKFLVTRSGKLYCTSAQVSGGIRATSLYIGNSNSNVVSGSGLSGDALNDGAVSSVKISNGAITVNKIADGAVSTTKIQGGAITAEKIKTGTITATQIAGNTITASQIAANTITSNEIAGNTITASQIAANTITSNEIASEAITTDKIKAGAITAEKLNTAADWGITIKDSTIASSVPRVNSKIDIGDTIYIEADLINFSAGEIWFPKYSVIRFPPTATVDGLTVKGVWG